MRKIVIVGSFSTGKTTLAEMLSTQLQLPLLPEVARQVIELGFKLDKDATAETETLIFLRQYAAEMTRPEFVGDRSLIDVMTYASWVMDNQPHRKENALWDACLNVAQQHLRSQYSHVFYLPVEFPIVADGLRPMDPEFQADIDERLRKLLVNHDIAHITVTGTIEDRLSQIHDSL